MMLGSMGRLGRLGIVVLLAWGCRNGDKDEDSDSDRAPDETDDTGGDGFCGDGEVDTDEECDLGEGNGAGENCLADCTPNPNQFVVVSAAESVEPADLDAQGVADDDAPSGDAAWAPSDTDLGGDGLAKFEIYVPLFDYRDVLGPEQLEALDAAPYQPPLSWLREHTVAEIDQISVWTKTPAGESGTPFYITLYTQQDGVEDTGWYGYRLTALPSAARNRDEPADTWVQWVVKGSDNQLTFADQPTIGVFTAPNLPTLPELVADDAFDWSSLQGSWPSTSRDYGAEVIRYISVQTGSGAETTGSDGLFDLLEIRFTDGRSLSVDFEL